MTKQPQWLNAEEQEFWSLLRSSARRVERATGGSVTANADVSLPEYSVLAALADAPKKALRLRELCSALEWDRSRMSHQITRMEQRGLVTKEKSNVDARGVVVRITQQGQDRVDAAKPGYVDAARRVVFDQLDYDDIPVLQKFLAAIVAATDDNAD